MVEGEIPRIVISYGIYLKNEKNKFISYQWNAIILFLDFQGLVLHYFLEYSNVIEYDNTSKDR